MKNQSNKDYKKSVDKIKEYLTKIKNNYTKVVRDIRINEVDKENNSILENEMKNVIKTELIEGILNDKRAIYSAFLKQVSKNIIKNDKSIKNNEENEEKIVNYLIYKRSEKKLEELTQKKHQKKLIII